MITVNLGGMDLSQNEGALLLDQLVGSAYTYNLNIGDALLTEGGAISMKDRATMNLDRNPDWRYGKGKSPQHLPRSGVDAQIGINPNLASFYHDTSGRRVLLSSVIFHELAEAYSKVDLGKQYHPLRPDGKPDATRGAHSDAVAREYRLRNQRPNLSTTGRAGDKLILVREPR
jgi:hypothetical protein